MTDDPLRGQAINGPTDDIEPDGVDPYDWEDGTFSGPVSPRFRIHAEEAVERARRKRERLRSSGDIHRPRGF